MKFMNRIDVAHDVLTILMNDQKGVKTTPVTKIVYDLLIDLLKRTCNPDGVEELMLSIQFDYADIDVDNSPAEDTTYWLNPEDCNYLLPMLAMI